MRVEEYLQEFGTTAPKLAKKCGVTPVTIRNIVNQNCDPQLSTALSIEVATKGQVTCREMLPKKHLELVLKGPKAEKSQKSPQKKNKQKKKHENK